MERDVSGGVKHCLLPVSSERIPNLYRRYPFLYTLYKKMKSYSKSELARAAGVCPDTLRRWLKTDQAFLQANGITPTTRLFPPKVVQYLCNKYCIDLPDETR